MQLKLNLFYPTGTENLIRDLSIIKEKSAMWFILHLLQGVYEDHPSSADEGDSRDLEKPTLALSEKRPSGPEKVCDTVTLAQQTL